jgi:ABC-2 type transport system permease protein
MRSLALAKRTFTEVWRDPLALALTIGLPAALLVVFQAFGQFDDIFKPASLTPGIVLFGFVMLMFSMAMTLSRDRETTLFARLLTAPLRSNEFVTAYSLPYIPVAIIQGLVLFAIGAAFGMEINGSLALVALILIVTAVFYIGLGMIIGSVFSYKTVPFAYMVILLLTIFGGAWMNLDSIGGAFQAVGNVFPFAHALDATRSVIVDGSDFAAIATDFFWVLGYTVATGALAIYLFKRQMID